MVAHSDNKNGAACLIIPTKPIFATIVNFVDNRLPLGNIMRPIILVPLDPFAPLLHNFWFFELLSNAEASYSIDVGIEFESMIQLVKVFFENVNELVLGGFDL